MFALILLDEGFMGEDSFARFGLRTSGLFGSWSRMVDTDCSEVCNRSRACSVDLVGGFTC